MQEVLIFQLNKKVPMLIALGALFYIYVLQYPLSQLLPDSTLGPEYGLGKWISGYFFVILSTVIFMAALHFGLNSASKSILITKQRHNIVIRRMSLPMVALIIIFFGLWTYLMVFYKLGMTIYADFHPLPLHMAGVLFYGRLFLQPLVLTYIATGYIYSKNKWFIFLLLSALACWVSIASGSRFASLAFAAPFLFLFKGKVRYLVFVSVFLGLITLATLTRSFYLPYIIGGEYIQIYANDQYLSSLIENLYFLPIFYIIYRPLGMGELLMTLDYGEITSSFSDALQTSLSYFFPFMFSSSGASIKNIYGLNDDVFGGFSLDMFSIYWTSFGGNIILYTFGLALIGWLLGKTYAQFAIGLARIGAAKLGVLVFALLFILTFEGRAFLIPWLFILGWLFSRREIPLLIFSLFSSK